MPRRVRKEWRVGCRVGVSRGDVKEAAVLSILRSFVVVF